MPAFVITRDSAREPERSDVYRNAIAGPGEAHHGGCIVRGAGNAYLAQVRPRGERVVLSRFPGAASVRAFIGSATFQTLRAVREGAADLAMRLVAA
jgi:uncharacterized protein (DUF1330 family)